MPWNEWAALLCVFVSLHSASYGLRHHEPGVTPWVLCFGSFYAAVGLLVWHNW